VLLPSRRSRKCQAISSHGHLIWRKRTSGRYEADQLPGVKYRSNTIVEMLYALSGDNRSSCRTAEPRLRPAFAS